VIIWVSRSNSGSLPQVFQGGCLPALLMTERAQQAQGIGVFRLLIEDLQIECLGLAELSSLMVPSGLLIAGLGIHGCRLIFQIFRRGTIFLSIWSPHDISGKFTPRSLLGLARRHEKISPQGSASTAPG